jgi:hypothetical protein
VECIAAAANSLTAAIEGMMEMKSEDQIYSNKV